MVAPDFFSQAVPLLGDLSNLDPVRLPMKKKKIV